MALPSLEQFRYYEDFDLVSDVTMLNDVAASFVLRAQDSRNYYLLQVTGGKADEPHVLRGFVVKNGVAARLGNTLPVTGYAHVISSGRTFELTIKCLGNKFTVWIVDSENGEKVSLGALTDYGRHFAIGAPGIAVRDQEQNEISRFVVTLPHPG